MEQETKLGLSVAVYKIFDENFCFYGDQDDIIDFLLKTKAIKKQDLKEKGWVWGLEQVRLTFKEIYYKEF